MRSLYVRVMRRVERFLHFRLFVIHTRLLDPEAPIDPVPSDCTVGVLNEPQLLGFADPALGLTADGIRRAHARGDVCFGYVERGALVSYMWVATGPTPAEGGLWVRFARPYCYTYKSLTVPTHRGRHLQECLVHLSDRWRTAHGYTHNIDYIDTLNLPSIAADRRYGNRPIGYAGYVTRRGETIPFRTRGAKRAGFEFFVPAPETDATGDRDTSHSHDR